MPSTTKTDLGVVNSRITNNQQPTTDRTTTSNTTEASSSSNNCSSSGGGGVNNQQEQHWTGQPPAVASNSDRTRVSFFCQSRECCGRPLLVCACSGTRPVWTAALKLRYDVRRLRRRECCGRPNSVNSAFARAPTRLGPRRFSILDIMSSLVAFFFLFLRFPLLATAARRTH